METTIKTTQVELKRQLEACDHEIARVAQLIVEQEERRDALRIVLGIRLENLPVSQTSPLEVVIRKPRVRVKKVDGRSNPRTKKFSSNILSILKESDEPVGIDFLLGQVERLVKKWIVKQEERPKRLYETLKRMEKSKKIVRVGSGEGRQGLWALPSRASTNTNKKTELKAVTAEA